MTDRIEFMDGFRLRLQCAMEIRGCSQAETSRATLISRQAITQILAQETCPRARKHGPTLWYVVKLANALRVDPGWLAFGYGSPPEAVGDDTEPGRSSGYYSCASKTSSMAR